MVEVSCGEFTVFLDSMERVINCTYACKITDFTSTKVVVVKYFNVLHLLLFYLMWNL